MVPLLIDKEFTCMSTLCYGFSLSFFSNYLLTLSDHFLLCIKSDSQGKFLFNLGKLEEEISTIWTNCESVNIFILILVGMYFDPGIVIYEFFLFSQIILNKFSFFVFGFYILFCQHADFLTSVFHIYFITERS